MGTLMSTLTSTPSAARTWSRSFGSWSWICLTVALPAAAAAADRGEAALCTAARSDRIDALSSIELRAEGFPPQLDDVTADAAALWNSAPCNAADRPRFLLGAPGDRTLLVHWNEGLTAAAAGVCGSFSGNEIHLYAFARDPGSGGLERCGDRARLVEVLAHELGHALGLYDQRSSPCAERIMGQLVRRADGSIAARRVHAEECRAVGQRFLTLEERLERTLHDDPLLATLGPSAPAWGLQ